MECCLYMQPIPALIRLMILPTSTASHCWQDKTMDLLCLFNGRACDEKLTSWVVYFPLTHSNVICFHFHRIKLIICTWVWLSLVANWCRNTAFGLVLAIGVLIKAAWQEMISPLFTLFQPSLLGRHTHTHRKLGEISDHLFVTWDCLNHKLCDLNVLYRRHLRVEFDTL